MTSQEPSSLLRHACQVLMIISAADGEEGRAPGVTWADVREQTDMKEHQINTSLRTLLREGKIYVLTDRHSHSGGKVYALNEDWNPTCVTPDRRWTVQAPEKRQVLNDKNLAKRRVRRIQEFVDQEIKTLPDYIRFRAKKIAVLVKHAKLANPDDRDVLLGIAEDYRRGADMVNGTHVKR